MTREVTCKCDCSMRACVSYIPPDRSEVPPLFPMRRGLKPHTRPSDQTCLSTLSRIATTARLDLPGPHTVHTPQRPHSVSRERTRGCEQCVADKGGRSAAKRRNWVAGTVFAGADSGASISQRLIRRCTCTTTNYTSTPTLHTRHSLSTSAHHVSVVGATWTECYRLDDLTRHC